MKVECAIGILELVGLFKIVPLFVGQLRILETNRLVDLLLVTVLSRIQPVGGLKLCHSTDVVSPLILVETFLEAQVGSLFTGLEKFRPVLSGIRLGTPAVTKVGTLKAPFSGAGTTFISTSKSRRCSN